jgi:cell division protein FtsI/penicillin-binding protein 2
LDVRVLSRVVVPLALLGLLAPLTACTGDDEPQPEQAAAALVRALNQGRLETAPILDRASLEPQRLLRRATQGMDDATFRVTLGDVVETESGQDAEAKLRYSWDLPETDRDWEHTGTAVLVQPDGGRWRVVLDASILGLREHERLELDTEPAERAGILGARDARIVTDRPVVRFGIDKAQVAPARQADSARALARVVDVEAGPLVERVRAAGPRAFVEAIVLREADAVRPLQAVGAIDGAGVIEDTMPLAPTREYARPILGTVGPVTAEIVEESGGAYEAGDVAGLSGLQERYDDQLRGSPGLVISAVREEGDDERSRELFRVAPRAGEPLRTTFDPELQLAAEEILADVRPASALVAIRPSDGDILAAANGPGTGGLNIATFGRFPPGSTFKIVSTLALLRGGVRPGEPVRCPGTTVVDGKEFENYDDYPAAGVGRITLATAVANSCNTAFINSRGRVSSLPEAAAALGLGIDHDLGFPAYFGAVPAEPASETGFAASMIGQGQVLASPMTMAAVIASVAQGRTVVPRLLPGHEPESAAPDPEQPLTRAEAATLRTLLRGVVERGSGRALSDVPGPPVIAKTGTAEFGDAEPLKTHAWMVAAQGELAVAAFVQVGDSGSGTAGPLLEEFLRRAG